MKIEIKQILNDTSYEIERKLPVGHLSQYAYLIAHLWHGNYASQDVVIERALRK